MAAEERIAAAVALGLSATGRYRVAAAPLFAVAAWRREEADRISTAGEENKASANVIGERIKTTSNVESQAGKDVARELERQGLVDSGTSSAIWQWFADRSSPLWNYGNDTASENWVASDGQARADLQDLADVEDTLRQVDARAKQLQQRAAAILTVQTDP